MSPALDEVAMVFGVDSDLVFNNVGLGGYIETKRVIGTGSSQAAGTYM